MGDVPDIARKKMTVSSWHPLFLEAHFRRQKAASKPSKDAFYATFSREINNFPWSDPMPKLGFGQRNLGSSPVCGRTAEEK
jgi:hypothetical protein